MTVFPKDKQCSKCGETFNCGGLLGCWCSDVKLDPETLATLKAQYDNCLCPACLKEFSAAVAPAVSPAAQDVV